MFNNALCALLLTTTCLCGVRAEDGPFKEAKQIAKLVAADAAADDNFGFSVSVSGSTIVVAARYDDDGGSNSGSAYVWKLLGPCTCCDRRMKSMGMNVDCAEVSDPTS